MYAINKNNKYILTDKDKFTERTDIDFEGDYGKYYIHLASLDNDGNLSKTNTYVFELQDPSINNSIIEDYISSNNDVNNIKPNDSHSNNSNNYYDNNVNVDYDESEIDLTMYYLNTQILL